jgi:hypothetical protein
MVNWILIPDQQSLGGDVLQEQTQTVVNKTYGTPNKIVYQLWVKLNMTI